MLLGISGALRAGSTNTKLVREAARVYGGPFMLADLNLPLYDGDLETSQGVPATVHRLVDQIADAEAVVISTPEYNQSLSGVLKNALDWISRVEAKPWKGKPVAIMAAAAGRAGGARGLYALRLAISPFGPRLLTGPEVLLANSSKQFDENGHLIEDSYRKSLAGVIEALKAEVARG